MSLFDLSNSAYELGDEEAQKNGIKYICETLCSAANITEKDKKSIEEFAECANLLDKVNYNELNITKENTLNTQPEKPEEVMEIDEEETIKIL